MIKKCLIVVNKIKSILTTKQKRLFWFVLFAAVIAAILESLSVSVIIPLVDVMLMPEKLFQYSWLKPVLLFFSIDTNQKMIFFVIFGTILLYLFKNLYLIFFSWIKAKYSSKIQRECSVFMMESYMNRGYTFFLNKNINEIIQGTVGDIQALFNVINSIIYILTKFLIVLMIGIFMIISDWLMATSLICAAAFCLLILVFGFKKPMKQIGERLRNYTIEANKVLYQAIFGIKEVLVMRKQKEFISEYKNFMLLRQREDIKRSVSTDAPNPIVEAFCITVVMIFFCIKIINKPGDTEFIAILASFAVGAFRILPAVGYLSSAFNTIISSMPSINAVYENIVEARQYNYSFNNINVEDKEQYSNHNFSKDIIVRNVSFSYSEDMPLVLDCLNLIIPKNKAIALIGESGVGKSTLADIILGILPLQQGEIMLDGISIQDIPNRWSELIGFVPQTIYLMDASIAQNIAFGVSKDKFDYKQIEKVLEMANLKEFVETLPNKVDTIVGDRGVRLSGGQRQRIGIARALYHNPEILILDEATSALDNTTEQAVMEAIESLQGNITMIVIAHRLSTIKNCDKIYEIVQGQAVERKYDELV